MTAPAAPASCRTGCARVAAPGRPAAVALPPRGLRPPARRRPGDPVPEPRQLPRLRVPDAARAAAHQLRRQGRVHGLVEDQVPVPGDGHDPDRPRAAATSSQAALDTAEAVLRRGELFGIFPEGTRSRDGVLYKGHTGAARLALKVGCPIFPVGVDRHPRDPAARRQAAQAAAWSAPSGSAGRSTSSATANRGDDHLVLRQITDEVMFEIRELTGQEYRNVYAGKTAETEPDRSSAKVAPRSTTTTAAGGRSSALPPAELSNRARPSGPADARRRLERPMAEITITLPDGSQRSLPAGATATDLAESIGSRLAKAAVAARGRRRGVGPRSRRCPTAPRWRSSPPTPTRAATCCATPRRT